MYDYMRELQHVFFREPDCTALREETNALYEKIAVQLSREDRRRLLALVDNEASLRNEVSLASFIAGFRLAVGLGKELSLERAFSFDEAEEHRACAALTKLQED